MDQRKHSNNALAATGMSRSEACTPDSEHLTHVEYELERRLQFEKLLVELSATFVNLSSEETYDKIAESMKTLVEALGHDRSTLAEFDEKKSARIIHSHTVTGKKPFTLKRMEDQALPWYFQQLRRGDLVFFDRPEELPQEADRERQFCAAEGIKSHIGIPLVAASTVLGVLNFSSFGRAGFWQKDILARIQLIGEVFANAILHKRDQEAINKALAESERLRKQLERENVYLREQITLKHEHRSMAGESRTLCKALAEAERVAVTETPVLLFGETGTGKELFAQEIHRLSTRKKKSRVVVNCASLPSTLIESELFGREAGAYTGAASAQRGRFEIADGSTLFLDEIGELPIELQSKLLRVLEDGRFQKLGSPETITVDVRIIAATNRDLERETRDGKFREDLYHRLNVVPIRIPPLRERSEDIPLLVWAFVEDLGRRMGKKISSIPRSVMDRLQQYNWPGNIRELRNLIERGMILTCNETLRIELPSSHQDHSWHRQTLKECERNHILRALQDTAWRIRGPGGASELLDIKPTTLEARMAKLGIKRPRG